VIDRGEIIALDTPINLKNLASEDTIEIQTNDNPKSIDEIKNAFPDIFVKQLGKNIIIKSEKGETFLPKVLEAITEDIISINLTKPSLEDIFLKLTGRQIR
jgi:ABC-2 type transport system ATP-binding protein